VLPVATLSNLLLDYQDPDELYRINSAEADGYRKAGLPALPNRSLSTPLELRRVMGWRDVLAQVSDQVLAGSVTVARSTLLNVNTAPLSVLAAMPGVDPAQAQRVVAARALRPFVTPYDFYALLGEEPVSPEALSLYPSPSGTLRLWPARGGAVQVLHW